MSSSPKVGIVTVTYNAAGFISTYLKGVETLLAERPDFQVFVVDNASADGTLERVRQELTGSDRQNQFLLIQEPENLGFGHGCNVGAKAAAEAGFEYIWFLNPDTVPTLEALDHLIQVATDTGAEFVGSQLTDGGTEVRTGSFRFPTLLTAFLSEAHVGVLDRFFHGSRVPLSIPDTPQPVGWVTGASFLARTKAFFELDGFDTAYFLYFEEVDLFLRATRRGMQVWTSPDSKLEHTSGASTGINQKKVDEPKSLPTYWYESRRRFLEKNFGTGYATASDVCAILGSAVGSTKALVRGSRPAVQGHIRALLRENLPSFLPKRTH